MPAKRCVETKNMCLLFVDYCTIPIFLIISGYQSAHALFIPILSRLNKTFYMVKDDLHQAGAGFGACPGDMWRDE